MRIKVGEHCVIFPDVTIGDGTRVGNFVFIRSHTQIGQGCIIGSYVDIEGDVVIGHHVSLQSSCYITRGVIIEDEVFCGPRVTTLNDKRMSYRRPSLTFVRAAPRILRAARVGGGAVLMPGVTIGENALEKMRWWAPVQWSQQTCQTRQSWSAIQPASWIGCRGRKLSSGPRRPEGASFGTARFAH